MFLGMHKLGPKLFRKLPFVKPCKKTLRTEAKKLDVKPGLNEFVQKGIQAALKEKDPGDFDCSLIMDEVSLRFDLTASEKDDLIKGYVDLGGGDTRNLPGDHALVFQIRSLYGSWKFPVRYYITNQKLNAEDFAALIPPVIRRLLAIGLRIRLLITDGLAKNIAAAFILGVTMATPWFFVDGCKVYYCVDVPHLLKCHRTAVKKYTLQLASRHPIKWEYIAGFLKRDLITKPRIAPKITEEHVKVGPFSIMNVELAAQVFRNTVAKGIMSYVAVGILPPAAKATADHCRDMNDLFDSFNGVKDSPRQEGESYKVALTDESGHLELWEKMRKQLTGWTFVNSKNIQFVDSWIMTIDAFRLLWTDLKAEGRKFFPVGHGNQDPMENFFSVFRGLLGHDHNPSAAEFAHGFIIAIVNSVSGSGSKKKNCKDDDAINLVPLQVLCDAAKQENETPSPSFASTDTPLNTSSSGRFDPQGSEELREEVMNEAAPLDLGSMGASTQVQPIIQKFLRDIGHCVACEEILLTTEPMLMHLPLLIFSSDQALRCPASLVIQVTQDIHKLCETMLPNILHQVGVFTGFHERVRALPSVLLFHLCPEHDEISMDSFLKAVERSAITGLLKSIVESYRRKRRSAEGEQNPDDYQEDGSYRPVSKKSFKLQRVSHL